ncbi:MAG TPA: hypothetical protein VHM90_15305, partial [Phycisphaerae bacterium]|nr:hypothetical protein [Phycisphaerae bacterium]
EAIVKYRYLAALVVLWSATIFADSIDEAEAKRRGVPVAQVQAENALAKEKARTVALEKQIAELKKQIDALPKEGAATAAPTGAGEAAPSASLGVDDGQTHLVQMFRPAVKDAYQTHVTVERSYTATRTPPGGRPDVQTVTLKADVTGVITVSSVQNGMISQMALMASKFTVNGRDGLPANTNIFVQPDPRGVDFSPPGNVEIGPETQQTLDMIFPRPDMMPTNEDDIYGSKAAHKVNEEWTIDTAAAARQLSLLSRMELDPSQLTGKGKIAGIETVNGVKALRVIISIDSRRLAPHPGFTLISGTMHVTLSRVVPLTPTPRLPEASLSADISMVENSPSDGRYEVKVHIARHDVNTDPPPQGK